MKTLKEVHDMLVMTGYKDEAEAVKNAMEKLGHCLECGSSDTGKHKANFFTPLIEWCNSCKTVKIAGERIEA